MIEFDSDEDTEYLMMTSSEERALLVENEIRPDVMNGVQYNSHDGRVSVKDPSESHEKKPRRTPCFVYILTFFSAIGGFLFGYDTGVVSGAMLLLKTAFNLTSVLEEVIVSSTIGFACLFALVGGFLNDRLGRKATTILSSAVFTIGALVLAFAQNVAMLIVGRSILGIGIGLASMTVPIYIAEASPPELRGRLVSLNNFFITGGQFIASVIDGAFSYDKKNGWRYMLGLAAVPAVVQFVGFIFLPESPRWLVSHGRMEEAKKVLSHIRGTKDVDEEIDEVKKSCDDDRKEREAAGGSSTLLKVLRTPSVRRAVIVGCGLQLFQQVSGINTVMYYSATIIKMSGFRDESTAIWLAAGTAFVNFAFTIVGVYLVERIGRRKLIIGSLFGVFVSLIVLAVGFQLSAVHSPPITLREDAVNSSVCHSYDWCESCIENLDCGFCYVEVGKSAVNGSCLPTLQDDSSHSTMGRCNTSDVESGSGSLVWAHQYCPTDYSWMGVLGLALYLMFFAPGMGPMPWTINSEIYPLWARSIGNSLSTATNWICNLVVAMTFLTLTETITKYGTYWMFVGIVFIGLIFMYTMVPETKGKKLEEVEELFSRPLCSCGPAKNSYKVTDIES